MDWYADLNSLADSIHRIRLRDGSRILSYLDVIELGQRSSDFRSWFSKPLTTLSMPACFWEVRPVSYCDVNEPFEYVVINAPSLELMSADDLPFRDKFSQGDGTVAIFENLARDATLVAPRPTLAATDYTHLMSFLRTASHHQIDQLWSLLFDCVARTLSDKPLWVSTSGLGVAWLHVRLDSRPKYYNFGPYRNPA